MRGMNSEEKKELTVGEILTVQPYIPYWPDYPKGRELESGPEQECDICKCAFSAIEFEGIICPDCIAQPEHAK